jgi:hypothetical protein
MAETLTCVADVTCNDLFIDVLYIFRLQIISLLFVVGELLSLLPLQAYLYYNILQYL